MRTRMIGLAGWASLPAIGLFGLPLGMALYQCTVQAERSDLQEDADRLAISVGGDAVTAPGPSRTATGWRRRQLRGAPAGSRTPAP